MANSGREAYFHKILVFLAIITAITGIINLTASGSVGIEDLGSGDYMQTLPGQSVPNIAIGSTGTPGAMGTATEGTQDYTTASGYDPNLTSISTNFVSGDQWSRSDGVGFASLYTDLYGLAYLNVIGAVPSDNKYDLTYHVYNQFSASPFYTMVTGSETGSWHISGYYIEYSENTVALVHSTDVNTKISYINYPYASSGQKIRTLYDVSRGEIEIDIDDQPVGVLDGAPTSAGQYQCGVAASHSSLDVSSIDGTFTKGASSTPGFWDGLIGQINGLVVFGSEFLGLLGACLGLTSNALIPFWLWAIIGIPCIATLILIYLEMARGN